MIKKYWPVIAIVVGIIVFIGVVLMIRKNNSATSDLQTDETETVVEIPVEQRPVAALVAKPDGHWLVLTVSSIKVTDATAMDYELLYKVGDGRTQGVPGTIQLNGQTSISRELLLGSESAGKFRYDTGVETGTLTLRFRNSSGKLLGKVSTDFHFQSGTVELSSVDGKFKYTLDKMAKGVYFITMQSFGTPDASKVVVFSNGWAVYASDGLPHSGKVN